MSGMCLPMVGHAYRSYTYIYIYIYIYLYIHIYKYISYSLGQPIYMVRRGIDDGITMEIQIGTS